MAERFSRKEAQLLRATKMSHVKGLTPIDICSLPSPIPLPLMLKKG